jgi:hypothetical protein
MKKILSILTLISLGILCVAQKDPTKFGEIPMEDMKMKVYPLDSSAEAAVLVDFGVAYISETSTGIALTFERHTRIKILKKGGLDYANSSVLLYHSGSAEEKLLSVKASAYNLEGEKIIESKMSKEVIFK